MVIINPGVDVLEIMEASEHFWPIFYNPKENTFYGEDGWFVSDLFTYVSPNDILIFKKKKCDMVIYSPRHAMNIGLYYMLPWWEDYPDEIEQ